MKNIFSWIEENKQQFEGDGPRTMAQEPRIGFGDGGIAKELKTFSRNFQIKKGKLPTQNEVVKGTGRAPKTIKSHLKIGRDFIVQSVFEVAKKAGIESGKAKVADLVLSGDEEGLKKLKKKVNKLNKKYNLADKGVTFKVSKTASGGNYTTALSYNAQVYRDAGIKKYKSGSLETLEKELKKFQKTDLYKNYSAHATYIKGGIESGKKQLANIGSKQVEIMKYLVDNPNADVATIAKDLKINSKLVKADLKDLYGNIYKRVGDQGAAFLKDYDLKQLNGARDAIKTININEGLNLKDKIKHLVTDAYQGDTAKLTPLLEKIDDFYTLQTKIKGTQYGKFFAGNLDHIIPLNFLEQVAAGEDPLNLIKVRPMPEYLNQRAWKSQFDRVLGTAWRNRLKPGGKEALETIINLQSYLPKEFGGITSTGNIIDYGAKPFSLKTNLSQADFPEIYKRVFQFINNPELQTTFKEAKVSFKTLAKQEKNIMGQMEGFNKLLISLCPKGKASGGRIGYQTAGSVGGTLECGLNVIKNNNIKTEAQAKTMLKIAEAGSKSRALRGMLGVWGLGGEAIIEAGIGAYKVLGQGVPADIAWSESYWSYLDPRKYTGELSDLRKKDLEKGNPRIAKYFDALGVLEKKDYHEKWVNQTNPDDPSYEYHRNKLNQYDDVMNSFYGGSSGIIKMLERVQPEVDEAEAIQAGRWAADAMPSTELQADRKQKQAMKELMESKGIKTMPYKKDGKPVYEIDKELIDTDLKMFGDIMGFGWTPYGLGFGMQQMKPGIGDMKYNEDLGYRQLIENIADSEARDKIAEVGGISRLAGGGMVGIRKPHAIAPTGGPQSQGLASTPEYDTYSKEYKWQT